MAYQKREMETTEQEIPPAKKKPYHDIHLTVMIIRGAGKVRSFKISSRIVFWATIFFLIYIPTSIFVINMFFELHHECIIQSEMIKRLESDLSESKKILYKSKQYIAFLEDNIPNFAERQEQESTALKGKNLLTSNTARSEGDLSINEDKKNKPTQVVDIQDMVIQKDGSTMTIDFNVVNIQPGENAVGGYIHIIGRDKESDPPQVWTCPKEKLRNGLPLNYRRGHRFLIERFKPIHGKFNLISSSEPPSTIKVLVYDQSGMLILEKEFEVSGVS